VSRKFNFIYSKIVEDENDFVGHVAYSLYKKDKVEFIEKFKEENQKDPTEEDLGKYHSTTSSANLISAYRIKAESLLEEFMNNTLEIAISESTENIKKSQEEILKEIIKPIRPPGFWQRVWDTSTANFTFAAIVALIIMIISFTSQGCWRTIGDLSGKEIKDKPSIVN
jgi:hypothetical protein